MKTPLLKSETDKIVFIPEAQEGRPTVPTFVAVIAVVLAMLLSGTLVYFWQQGRIHDLEAVAQDARITATAARVDANAALAVNAQLQVEITDLQKQLKDARQRAKIFKGQSKSAEGQLQHTQEKLKAVKGELAAVTGPKLTNGDHVGYILAAGSAEVPPMIVIQVGRWFTGPQAQKAALADFAIVAGEHVNHNRYLRTTDGTWRVVDVAAGALFTVHHYNGTTSSVSVSLSTLAGILASPSSSNERTAHNPFKVTVSGGMVTSGHEQSYVAP